MGTLRISLQRPSENFSWEEAEQTNHRNIDNVIPDELEETIVSTAKKMEAVRTVLNTVRKCSILVSSWYRCPELNIAVGSSNRSVHPKGMAVDFIAPKFGSPKEVVAYLMQYSESLNYDQLIYEKTWVHIGWDPAGKNRSQVLTLNRDGTYSQGLVS